ncbi:MAG: hypothetical protein Q4D38_06950 [Planctomycetia bacterium]|nr:hypothetical protein [Planctomycetia bacterium]
MFLALKILLCVLAAGNPLLARYYCNAHHRYILAQEDCDAASAHAAICSCCCGSHAPEGESKGASEGEPTEEEESANHDGARCSHPLGECKLQTVGSGVMFRTFASSEEIEFDVAIVCWDSNFHSILDDFVPHGFRSFSLALEVDSFRESPLYIEYRSLLI